jgi:poly-gamma-glutamate synthesis protein (capsule biosynthesis protein)
MSSGPVVLAAVGDVFLNRAAAAVAFQHAQPWLDAVDLRFGNCEGVYTDRSERAPSAGFAVVAPPECGKAVGAAGFDVMSLANNHTLDAGHGGLGDTMEVLQAQGVAAVGAGPSLPDARAIRTVVRGGRRIAFIAATSVFQPGYEARARVPGVAPLRVHWSYYYPEWDPYGRLEPGSRPHVRTFPYPEDLQDLEARIRAARDTHDVVIVSLHWGDSSRPAFLHDYEKTYGRAAIDAGADAVLGHHHHFLRGAEIYRGRPILYGLGHFVFDLVGLEALPADALARLHSLGEYAIYPRAGWPLLPFHSDARMTVMAFLCFGGGTGAETFLLPFVLEPDNCPRPCYAEGEAGRRVVDYLERISRAADLSVTFEPATLPRGGGVGVRVC